MTCERLGRGEARECVVSSERHSYPEVHNYLRFFGCHSWELSMKIARAYRRLILTLIIGLSLPALAQNESEEEVVTEELGTGEIEINYWNGFTGPDGATMVEMVRSFVEENPDVRVNIQMMPWNIYFDKLAAALVAGGGGPDLMVLWHSVVPQYALPGHLLPVAQMMFENGMLEASDFSQSTLEAVTFDGQAYTVPLDTYGVGLYVNVDLLERAGIDPNAPPSNQQEFLDYARRLTWDVNGNNPGDEGFDPNNIDVWGFTIDVPRYTVQPALYQWGTDIVSRDGSEVLINSEEAVAATQFFVDLINEHHVAPSPEGFDANTALVNGKLAMYPSGSWMYNFFNQQDVNVKLWPYPRLGPERGSTIMWSHTLAVPQNVEGEKLEATMRLIKYLSDHSDTWTAEAGMPTARLSLRNEGLKEQVWTLASFDEQFTAEGVMEFSSDRFSEIMDAVSAAWSSAFTLQASPEEALNDAAGQIEQALR